MIHWQDPTPVDEQQKWSEWSMHARKTTGKSQRHANNFASAFILLLAAAVVSGLPHQLMA